MTKEHTRKPPTSCQSNLYYHCFTFWWVHQWRSIAQAIGQMLRMPFTSLITIVVIAITMALPLSCMVLLLNGQQWQPDWSKQSQISIYLKSGVSNEAGMRLSNAIINQNDVLQSRYISPEEGMKTFKERTGLGNALDDLSDNPLPGVVVITPKRDLNDKQLDAMKERLSNDPLVESVKMDLQWVKRLHALLALGQKSTMWLALLLTFGVLLIIGNIIISTLQYYRHDIHVYLLLGASHYFIRQPFMMMGALYGMLGSIGAWMLVSLGVHYLRPSVEYLAAQYQMTYEIINISIPQGVLLVLLGALLGLIASRLTVLRYLLKG